MKKTLLFPYSDKMLYLEHLCPLPLTSQQHVSSSLRSRLPHKSAKLMPLNDKLMSMNKKYTSNSIE